MGITGVGKTATIHSVLGLPPPTMGGFEPETKQVVHCPPCTFLPADIVASDHNVLISALPCNIKLALGSRGIHLNKHGLTSIHSQVRVLDGAINGIRVRFIDTPGLQAAASAVGYNARVLGQIRKAHRKCKPDNVLYFDRLDQVRLLGPRLCSVFTAFGAGHMPWILL